MLHSRKAGNKTNNLLKTRLLIIITPFLKCPNSVFLAGHMVNVAGITRESRGNHAELCGSWHYKTMIENRGKGEVLRQIQSKGDKSEKEYCQNTVQKDNLWAILNGELCELNEFFLVHKGHKRIQKIILRARRARTQDIVGRER